ncbi:MAG: 16S rRNA (cytidine(1402)-2'-O)-methyltransferase [Gemmatimonadaceae bacterium]
MSALSESPDAVESANTAGALYVVSTPIGNLGDITYRAVEVLRSVSLIVAEDTRHSRTLLSHYQIGTPAIAYHEHNEARETPRLVRRMAQGESVALISDAGTPLLSDPGARLVRAAAGAGVSVIPIPGASALLAAVVASGIPADQFTFAGFLPRKGSDREQALRSIQLATVTTVFYESPQRVGDTLADLIRVGCGDREGALCRELTKRYEEVRRGTISALRDAVGESPRGEFVLIVGPGAERELSEAEARTVAAGLHEEGLSARDIVERLTQEFCVPRNAAYKLAHERPGSSLGD